MGVTMGVEEAGVAPPGASTVDDAWQGAAMLRLPEVERLRWPPGVMDPTLLAPR